jgi:uncharacterized protein
MMTSFPCSFLFHGSLNDFLSHKQKGQPLSLSVPFSSTVKDTIEAIDVPHVEVRKITVNKVGKNFAYLLQPNDAVEVFPYSDQFPPDAPKSFVLDVHLGGLARLLRMLGIDTFYQNNLHDKEIVALAIKEERAVLTRDIGLLKHKVLQYGYWLRSQQSEEQLMEVIQRFSLCTVLRPFSRCMACNGLLAAVSKEKIIHLLPAKTQVYFHDFFQCTQCANVYWKGSHYQNMQRLVERIKSVACQ